MGASSRPLKSSTEHPASPASRACRSGAGTGTAWPSRRARSTGRSSCDGHSAASLPEPADRKSGAWAGRRGWMLLDDFGAELGWDAPVELREDVIRAFARIQVEAAGQADRLLVAGCLDRRLDWLAAGGGARLPPGGGTRRAAPVDPAARL